MIISFDIAFFGILTVCLVTYRWCRCAAAILITFTNDLIILFFSNTRREVAVTRCYLSHYFHVPECMLSFTNFSYTLSTFFSFNCRISATHVSRWLAKDKQPMSMQCLRKVTEIEATSKKWLTIISLFFVIGVGSKEKIWIVIAYLNVSFLHLCNCRWLMYSVKLRDKNCFVFGERVKNLNRSGLAYRKVQEKNIFFVQRDILAKFQ